MTGPALRRSPEEDMGDVLASIRRLIAQEPALAAPRDPAPPAPPATDVANLPPEPALPTRTADLARAVEAAAARINAASERAEAVRQSGEPQPPLRLRPDALIPDALVPAAEPTRLPEGRLRLSAALAVVEPGPEAETGTIAPPPAPEAGTHGQAVPDPVPTAPTQPELAEPELAQPAPALGPQVARLIRAAQDGQFDPEPPVQALSSAAGLVAAAPAAPAQTPPQPIGQADAPLPHAPAIPAAPLAPPAAAVAQAVVARGAAEALAAAPAGEVAQATETAPRAPVPTAPAIRQSAVADAPGRLPERLAADPFEDSAALHLFAPADEDIPNGSILRSLLREAIRQELHGEMGSRFSRNLRQVIRHEVSRAVAEALGNH